MKNNMPFFRVLWHPLSLIGDIKFGFTLSPTVPSPLYLSLALPLVLLYGCPNSKSDKEDHKTKNPSEEKSQNTGKSGERAGKEINVETIVFAKQDFSQEVKVPVILEGRRQVQVFSRNTGRILGPLPSAGSYVKQGVKLFSVDRSEPGESYLPAPVLAPISGKLAQWYLSESENTSAQQPVALIVDDYALRAQVPLAADDWRKFSVSSKISLLSSHQERAAKVISTTAAVQSDTGRALITVEVPNTQKDWNVGSAAIAKILLPTEKKWIIPSAALVLTNNGTFIYIVENQVALRKKIDFNLLSNDFVEVLNPSFPEGTKVITSGFARLADGTKVKIANEQKPNAAGEKSSSPGTEAIK